MPMAAGSKEDKQSAGRLSAHTTTARWLCCRRSRRRSHGRGGDGDASRRRSHGESKLEYLHVLWQRQTLAQKCQRPTPTQQLIWRSELSTESCRPTGRAWKRGALFSPTATTGGTYCFRSGESCRHRRVVTSVCARVRRLLVEVHRYPRLRGKMKATQIHITRVVERPGTFHFSGGKVVKVPRFEVTSVADCTLRNETKVGERTRLHE